MASLLFSKKGHSANHQLQRRARRHATINVVDFSDVTRCQNMVDVSDNASEQARKGFLCL
jgi:hypothetical protein